MHSLKETLLQAHKFKCSRTWPNAGNLWSCTPNDHRIVQASAGCLLLIIPIHHEVAHSMASMTSAKGQVECLHRMCDCTLIVAQDKSMQLQLATLIFTTRETWHAGDQAPVRISTGGACRLRTLRAAVEGETSLARDAASGKKTSEQGPKALLGWRVRLGCTGAGSGPAVVSTSGAPSNQPASSVTVEQPISPFSPKPCNGKVVGDLELENKCDTDGVQSDT